MPYSILVPFIQPVLFTFCAANELFFASLYMFYFGPGLLSKLIMVV